MLFVEASIEKDKEDCMNSQDSGFGTQILTQGITQKLFPRQSLKRFNFVSYQVTQYFSC